MDLRQLRYFVSITECGSLSRASRELHIAQPALSQQIAKLEREIGKPLLTRSSKGVTPTANGLALFHHARFMLRQMDQALSIARSESGPTRGMVSVGLPATTVAAVGLRLVQRVRQRYPKVLLNVVEGMSGHIGELMRKGQLDLAVLFAGNVATGAVVEPLLTEHLFLILPRHSTLVAPERTTITLEEAAGLPLILPTSSHGLRQRIELECENRGLSLNVVAEIDSLSLLMSCVYDNIGATIKPIGAVLHEGRSGREWRYLGFSDAALRRRNFLYSLPSERLTPAAALIAGELKEIAMELVEGDCGPGFERVSALPARRPPEVAA